VAERGSRSANDGEDVEAPRGAAAFVEGDESASRRPAAGPDKRGGELERVRGAEPRKALQRSPIAEYAIDICKAER
jgi:hypothetical protein